MLIKGHLKSNKTDILVQEYAKLLNGGAVSGEILVIVQNFKKRTEFIEKTKALLKLDALTSFNVYTFFGLVYNSILDNWVIIENKIKNNNAKISPNLSGLEVSQYIFRKAIDEVQFRGYNSKGNLLHQLLRRYSLCVLNALTADEIKEKAKILSDPFYSDIKNALNLYKLKTLNLRAFDYLRQTDIFKFVYENTVNPYKYVILDDADEITPALFEYLKFIKKDVNEFFIAFDEFGCTRKGFLGALEFDFERFLDETPVFVTADDVKTKKGDEIFHSVKKGESVLIENSTKQSFIRQDEMITETVRRINELLSDPKNKLKPSDIAIVTPNIDDYLKFQLEKIKAPVQYLSGSEKLSKNPYIAALLEILKVLNNKNLKISPYIFRGILAKILGVDFNLVLKISDNYEVFDSDVFECLMNFSDNEKISRFVELCKEISGQKLSFQLFALAKEYVGMKPENKPLIYKINQLLKQVRDFEEIFNAEGLNGFSNEENNPEGSFNTEVSNRELILQLENTIVSENPLSGANVVEDSVVVSTAQKLIDNAVSSKYTFLLDTTSSNWTKQDIGPLYNAWVFQKSWKKKSFELEDNINCALDKTARLIRKIYLLNDGEIFIYSSIYDFLGAENFKGINHFFIEKPAMEAELSENAASNSLLVPKKEFKIIPRPDQAPVLEYQGGKMAVSAVAGAGKTTIMLALILKLLNENVPSENIFVLTFMESAARNFKERIKENFPHLVELPHISTIHGLALRILRENNNHTKLNLDVDFEILDEIKRGQIIRDIISTLGLDLSKAELYERAISAYKNQKHRQPDKLSPLFKRIFETYKTTLLSSNYIDYDDLLALSLMLLRSDKGVREYYQNLMKFVIEDEAQDSSEIQQELIKILSSKNGNLIRCGDVNQAITTTFSNADVKGFKKFIQENLNVKMDHSNRNATGIIDFSNLLIKYGEKTASGAFLPVETKPVEGKNIEDKNSVEEYIFEKESDEKSFILNKINEIREFDTKRCENGSAGLNSGGKNSSIAILLRSNKGVLDWSNFFFENSTFDFATNSETLDLNPVFKTVLAVLNFINNPLNNTVVKNCAKVLMELGFYRDDTEVLNFLDTLNTPFILGNNEYFSIFWDLKYFIGMWNLPVYEIAYKVGEFYFAKENPKNDGTSGQQANISLVSGIVSKVFGVNKTFEDTVKKLNDMAKKANRTGIKLISDAETNNSSAIRILTLHKSKGDEFDYVFIPEMYTDNLTFDINDIKLKENSKFIESVKTEPKNEEELKKEIMEENLRLAYVGVTRAKRKLYLSSAREYKIYNKVREKAPNGMFDITKNGVTG